MSKLIAHVPRETPLPTTDKLTAQHEPCQHSSTLALVGGRSPQRSTILMANKLTNTLMAHNLMPLSGRTLTATLNHTSRQHQYHHATNADSPPRRLDLWCFCRSSSSAWLPLLPLRSQGLRLSCKHQARKVRAVLPLRASILR